MLSIFIKSAISKIKSFKWKYPPNSLFLSYSKPISWYQAGLIIPKDNQKIVYIPINTAFVTTKNNLGLFVDNLPAWLAIILLSIYYIISCPLYLIINLLLEFSILILIIFSWFFKIFTTKWKDL